MSAADTTGLAHTVGDALQQLLHELRVTRPTLAQRLGVAAGTVTSWCLGDRLVPLWRFPQVEAALGVHRGYLLIKAGLVDLDGAEGQLVAIHVRGVDMVVLNGQVRSL